jgi:hypothetical protein
MAHLMAVCLHAVVFLCIISCYDVFFWFHELMPIFLKK